jgi:hypothetical protein
MRPRSLLVVPLVAILAACASRTDAPAADAPPPAAAAESAPAAEPVAAQPVAETVVVTKPVTAEPTPAKPVAAAPVVKETVVVKTAARPVVERPAAAPSATAASGDGAYPGLRILEFKAAVRRPGAASAELDSRATKSATLYIINSTTCPYCAAYVDRIKAIETAYIAKGVDVVHVYPNRKESDADKIAWHEAKGFRGGLILDAGAAIAKGLEAEKTPTAYLADASGMIVYRGAIDSGAYAKSGQEPYLANAIDAFLAHRKLDKDTTEPAG